ncbi:protein adenylyltransferase SelO [Corynebacterium diphtheriae]
MPLTFAHSFADAVPSLSVPWRAEQWPDPRIIVFNHELGQELGIDEASLLSNITQQGHAQAYSGHQFGQFNPLLGDGRALVLGDCAQTNAPHGQFEISLKGSGPTPFARRGDGRATLGPMLREYLISEELHGLGIPTTRSLAVITTGTDVQRERFLPGAVVVRVAQNHLRVGSVQCAAMRDDDSLAALVRYALSSHEDGVSDAEAAGLLLRRVSTSQAKLVAQWMRFGFVHGVMNTDNVTLSGQTIDFGPCAFIDSFHPQAVFSSIDSHGRYSFGRQPSIMGWNIARLAEALLPLMSIDEARNIVHEFPDMYRRSWLDEMADAVGISPDDDHTAGVLDDLVALLDVHRPDYAQFMRSLSDGTTVSLFPWAQQWEAEVSSLRVAAPRNPVYVPRNYLVEDALEHAMNADMSVFSLLVEAGKNPYLREKRFEKLENPAPETWQDYVTYCGT